jgi:hypothetical protein
MAPILHLLELRVSCGFGKTVKIGSVRKSSKQFTFVTELGLPAFYHKPVAESNIEIPHICWEEKCGKGDPS